MRNFNDVLRGLIVCSFAALAGAGCGGDSEVGESEAEAEAESESESESESEAEGDDCGNGAIDDGEDCDGDDLNNQTCVSQMLDGDGLACGDDCLFDKTACTGPDLMVYAEGLLIGSEIESGYTPTDCEVACGCPAGSGDRTVFHFSLVSENVGNATLYFGNPANVEEPYEDLWTFSSACGWYQFDDYATYWLCPDSEPDCALPDAEHVAEGHKASFCFIENFGAAPDYTGPPVSCSPPMYGCNDMGQRAGCADDYYVGLDCQWIDVTDLPSGDYQLCAHIDPTNVIYELRDDNNIGCADISF